MQAQEIVRRHYSGGAFLSIFWIAVLLMVAGGGVAASDGEGAGRELAQRVYDRPDGDDSSTRGTMVLEEPGRSPRVRQMFIYRQDAGEGGVRSLVRFTAPADISGTGLLTLDYPDGSSDQWIYLPALDRSRRVPSSRKGGRFVGSDIYYEDLQDRKVEMDRHRLLGDAEISGAPALLLESIPVDPANSTYGKRVSWIHEPSLLPLRIDFYAPGGEDEPVKRMEVSRLEQIQGYWTVMDSTFTDVGSGHHTRLVVERVVYDQGLPDALFTSRMLEDPERESVFRP